MTSGEVVKYMGASDAADSPIVARRRVRLALRDARDARKLTQSQVAEAMDWSTSKIMRIETGEVTVSPNDLRPLLAHLGIVDRHQVDALIRDAKSSRQRKQWWDAPKYRDQLTLPTRQLIQYEMEATAVAHYAATVIPGPLQTKAYAKAVLARWREELDEAYLNAQLDVRMRRREQFQAREPAPALRVLLDESLLFRQIGGADVLAEQLGDLIALTQRSAARLRVMPFEVDAPISNVASYDIYYLGEKEDEVDAVVYREMHKSDELVEERLEVRRHVEIFEQAWEASLDESASTEMLHLKAVSMHAPQ